MFLTIKGDVFINKRGVFYILELLRLKSNGFVEILIISSKTSIRWTPR